MQARRALFPLRQVRKSMDLRCLRDSQVKRKELKMPGKRRVVNWMPESDILKADARGLTLDEIADLNYQKTGDRPTKSAVCKYLKRLGAEPRQVPSGDLMPWRVKMEHYQSPERYMLHAVSQVRAKGWDNVSYDTRKKARRLAEILEGNGNRKPLVVDYNPETGFCFRIREDADTDIVRRPKQRKGTIR